MSALDDLIDELRAEAEVKVRTEYENRITALEGELKHAQGTLVGLDHRHRSLETDFAVLADRHSSLVAGLEALLER